MPEYSYLDFERDSDDNKAVGSALVTRCPEGWAGDRVNEFCSAHASATRTLGDRTLFAPLDSEGNPVSQQAGTLALQDANNVTFTGGVIDGLRGAVPVGSVIFYAFTFATYVANFSILFNQGWIIADGRTVINPFTGAVIGTPNLIGRYPFGAGSDAQTVAGSFTQGTSAAGAHSHAAATGVAGAHAHGGATAGFVLNTDHVPSTLLTDISIGGSGGNQGTGTAAITKERAGGDQAHAHGIFSDGNHQHSIATDGTHGHTVTVQPPSLFMIPLFRAF